MDFINLYEIEQQKRTLSIVLSAERRMLRRREDGGDLTNVQHKPNWKWQINPPCITNIS
jgi:hypothetical protein